MTQYKSQNGDPQSTIEACLKTYEVCLRTLAAGLEINEDQDFITALQLCSQASQLAAQAMLLDSEFYVKACGLCADFCEEVAELCEDFEETEMRYCAEVCLKCAKSCRALVGTHAASPQALQSDVRLV